MRLTLQGVSHGFAAGRPLFAPIWAEFSSGQLVAVTGPSGAGKSTLLTILAGLTEPSQGTVSRSGSGRACWVTQNPHGVAARTALDHVALSFLARGCRRAEADGMARALLGRFGLDDVAEQRFSTLSGGQAQRLMLARGMAASPAILLVDEPTAQLDLETAAEVDEALRSLAGTDTIVFVATHSPTTRAACSDTLALARPEHD